MKRALFFLCWIAACHRTKPSRIFQLRPVDRDTAVAIWGAEGAVDLRLGKTASDGSRGWSISLGDHADETHATLAVDHSHILLSHQGRYLWVVDAFDLNDGRQLWSSQIPALHDHPTMRVESDGIVLWDRSSVAILSRDTGHIRTNMQVAADSSVTVTKKFVVIDGSDDVVAISILSGSIARQARTLRGCADEDEYLAFADDHIVVYRLSDFSVSTVAPTTRPMMINACGTYEGARVLTSLVFDEHHVIGTAVLVIDGTGTITHTFEFPSDEIAFIGTSPRWRGRTELNGRLTRYVAIATRARDAKTTQVFELDLQAMTSKSVASLDELEIILFLVDTHWLWLPAYGVTPTLFSLDGETGVVATKTVVATNIPQLQPNDVAGSTLWMYTGNWTTGDFEVTRLDSALRPLN